MQTHNIIPGTPEWHAHRVTHRNASDAPAMLGCSAYKTRTQLLTEKRTGIAPEVDAGTEARFADGHRFEAMARPIGEEIIGDDLAPVVGSKGKESASYDGLTLMGDAPWEHKSLNDEIRSALPNQGRDSHLHNDGAKLGKMYRVQMEQQLLVCGAARNLFSATRWEGDELQEERHAWYHSDPALRAEILAGWDQFDVDLATHEPAEVIMPAVAAPQMGLPAVLIKVEGSIALVDNLPEIGVALNAYISRINKKPETDQDFANLESTVKSLKAFEEAITASEENALAQVGSVDGMRKTVAMYRELASSNRIFVDKLVKVEKENRRTKIIGDAVAAFHTHMRGLNERLGKPYMPAIQGEFQLVVKGLKSLDSMKDKVATELARCKIEANAASDKIQTNLNTLRELAANHAFLFADAAQIVLKAPDDLTMLVKSRISEHQAAEEKKEAEQRERIRAEEQAKAQREAAEQAAKDLQRVKDEAYLAGAEQRERERQAEIAGVVLAMRQQAESAIQPGPAVTHDAVVKIMMPPAVIQAMAPKEAPATPPSLRLGQISERLGFSLTADFLRTLGFEPAGRERAAVLYHEADFPRMCAALVKHISSVCELQAA